MNIISNLILIYIITVRADNSDEPDENDDVVEVVDPKKSLSDNVKVLNKDNISKILEDNPYVMINFHAPWCEHCETLAPEYINAADTLSWKGSGVVFGTVDVSEEKEIAEKYQVQNLPKMIFFRHSEGVDYSGTKAASGMVEWVEKKTQEGIIPITRPGELQYLVDEEKIFVVGYFSDLQSDEYKIFESTYYEVDEVKFFLVSDPELMKEYHQNDGSIMVMKTFDEKLSYFSENLTKENLKNFILREIMPLVVDFSAENANKIFDSKIRNHFIFMSDKNDKQHSEMMRTVSVMSKV